MVRLLAALASSRMEAFGILEVAARFGKRQVLSNGRRSSGVVRRSLWAIGLRFGSFLACAPPLLVSRALVSPLPAWARELAARSLAPS